MPFNRASPAPTTPTPATGARPSFGSRPAAPAPAQEPAHQAHPAARPSFGSRPVGGAQPRSPFAGVEQAEVMRRGAYLTDGMYILEILNAQYKHGRQKEMVIVECTVVTSNFDPQTNPGANREGSKVSIFMPKNDSFLGNVKSLIIAAWGFDADGNPCPLDQEVTEDDCSSLIDQRQAFAGVYVAVEAITKPTSNNGVYTHLNYFPVPLDAAGKPDLDKVSFHD